MEVLFPQFGIFGEILKYCIECQECSCQNIFENIRYKLRNTKVVQNKV